MGRVRTHMVVVCSGWGPSGRRFKSGLPDNRKLASEAGLHLELKAQPGPGADELQQVRVELQLARQLCHPARCAGNDLQGRVRDELRRLPRRGVDVLLLGSSGVRWFRDMGNRPK
jgi:hypothetical protein